LIYLVLDIITWKTSIKQKRKEKIMIDKFLRVAQQCATYFYLEEGDILIHHNQQNNA